MTQRTFKSLKILFDLADIPAIYLGLLASFYLRFHSGLFDVEKGIPPIAAYQRTFFGIACLWYLLFWLEGVYAMRGRFTLDQFFRVVKTVFMASVLLLATVFFFRSFAYSRLTVVLGLSVTTVLLAIFHAFKRHLLFHLHQRGLGVRRAVILGAGDSVRTCFDRISRNPELGIQVVGALTEAEEAVADCPRLGAPASIRQVLLDHQVEDVFVAWPEFSAKRVMELIQTADMAGVTFRVIPDVYSIIASSVHLGEMAGLPVINIGLLPIHGFQGTLKHALDFVLSLAGLIAVAPLLALVALLIRLESRGSIIYRQERVGLDGRPFTIYKMRSMREDAEVQTGPVWASKKDPRATRVGAFIRKYSIDELPQLYNVLRGDMSLVGPRPERPVFVDQFKSQIPDYMQRHRVRTGITGWAQINGLRGECSIEERTKYDIWYIENWSVFLDLEILLKTIWVCLFKPEGS
ncbi:MAG: undecaprenyl-phosphate glucose phosphotransferase [Candidatus Wallbacteria bacterium]|nr:undecaprenyl-phosphate glucose phosphotransferase [Candidatus Wallbacteria bacterium]